MSTLNTDQIAFVQAQGRAADGWQALPADASPRRYFRQAGASDGPCMLMVTTPDAPDLIAFVKIAKHLERLGLSAPAILSANISAGLALIEDFGDTTYTRLLADGADETALYDLATDALAGLHNSAGSIAIDLPAYDMDALMREVTLFADWFAPTVPAAQNLTGFAGQFDNLWRDALADVATRHDALVLRDYHVDNLMLLKDRSGVAQCGLLDFQDALIGSPAYDLMSLTQDARRDVAPELEDRLLARYFAARPDLDRAQFMMDFHVLAAQRHTKIAGIFQRLAQRDGKAHYLAHIPRVLRLLDRALTKSGMGELQTLLNRVLSGWQDAAGSR